MGLVGDELVLDEHKHIGERTKAAVPRVELNGVVVVVFAVSLSCYCCVGCRPMVLCVFLPTAIFFLLVVFCWSSSSFLVSLY